MANGTWIVSILLEKVLAILSFCYCETKFEFFRPRSYWKVFFNVVFLLKIPFYKHDTETTIRLTPYDRNHVDCLWSLLNKGSAVSLSVPSNRWTKPLEIIYLFFWNSIWNKVQQCVAGAGERSKFFLQKAYVIPTLSMSKVSKSTIVKTPKSHSGFLRMWNTAFLDRQQWHSTSMCKVY